MKLLFAEEIIAKENNEKKLIEHSLHARIRVLHAIIIDCNFLLICEKIHSRNCLHVLIKSCFGWNDHRKSTKWWAVWWTIIISWFWGFDTRSAENIFLIAVLWFLHVLVTILQNLVRKAHEVWLSRQYPTISGELQDTRFSQRFTASDHGYNIFCKSFSIYHVESRCSFTSFGYIQKRAATSSARTISSSRFYIARLTLPVFHISRHYFRRTRQ